MSTPDGSDGRVRGLFRGLSGRDDPVPLTLIVTACFLSVIALTVGWLADGKALLVNVASSLVLIAPALVITHFVIRRWRHKQTKPVATSALRHVGLLNSRLADDMDPDKDSTVGEDEVTLRALPGLMDLRDVTRRLDRDLQRLQSTFDLTQAEDALTRLDRLATEWDGLRGRSQRRGLVDVLESDIKRESSTLETSIKDALPSYMLDRDRKLPPGNS